MLLKTLSGSFYEVESTESGHRVRRVIAGAQSETIRATEEWREAITLLPNPPIVGQPVLIAWGIRRDSEDSALVETTLTSEVLEVFDEASASAARTSSPRS